MLEITETSNFSEKNTEKYLSQMNISMQNFNPINDNKFLCKQ